jgi:hypothetical protein
MSTLSPAPEKDWASPPSYPNVRCVSGHPDEPGYLVCKHVLRGERVGHFERVRPDRLGIAVCETCRSAEPSKRARSLILACRQCSGLLPALQNANGQMPQPTNSAEGSVDAKGRQ